MSTAWIKWTTVSPVC